MVLNYNQPITRENLDLVSYAAKFKLADDYLSGKNRSVGVLRRLLLDPTTFIYLNFMLDGRRFKYYPYQDMIINDKHRFKYFRAANQIGKSMCLDSKVAMNLLLDHGKGFNSAIVSKSLPQSMFQMRRVKSLLNTMPGISWNEVKGSTDSMSIISCDIKDNKGKVKYTNYLICAPCTEGLLGYDIHDLNLDEFEFWDVDLDYFYNQIAEPRTYHTKGSITIFSNPNGTESYGAKLEEITLPNLNKKYHTYVFNFLDKPGNTEEELEYAKAGKSRAQIESTLLAIRTLSDRYYFSADEIEQSYSKTLDLEGLAHGSDKETYWFLDVGTKKDHSVLVGATRSIDDELPHINIFFIKQYPQGYPLSRVVGSFDEVQSTDGWHYEKSVREYLEDFQLVKGVNPVFGCDVTGNSAMIPLFRSVGVSVVDVTFSGKKKWAMYQRMKYYFEKKLLHRIKSKEFETQMSRIIVTKLLTSAYNRVGHENENDFDDVPDAVAGCISLADNPFIITPGFTRLEGKESK